MATFSPMRILLIEDDPNFVKHVEGAVQDLKAEFVACMTAREGLKRFFQGDIDIVIVDGLLPDKTGLRIIEEIRARQMPGKIVFLSAFYNDVRSFRKLTSLGVDLVLQKPIAQSDLKAKLMNLLPQTLRQKTLETDFTSEFESLKEDYLEKVQLVWAPRFQRLIERAESDDPTAVAEIKVLCHKLRSTAGIYKQERIADAAALLEEGLQNRELSRLVPEMKEFLHLLRISGPSSVESDNSLSLAMRFQSAIVVTASEVMYVNVLEELDANAVLAYHTESLSMTLRGVLRWHPDVLIVDTALVDPKRGTPVLHSLVQYMTGVPILAVGESCSIPPGVLRAHDSGHAVLKALQAPDVQPLSGSTLLLCDDNPAVHRAVQDLFAPLGMMVEIVANGEDYLAGLDVFRPTVVLMDVGFATGGIDLCRISRNEAANRDIPTIFLSAQTTLAERQRAYRNGAAGYVQKPFANEQLVVEVSRCVRAQRVSRFAQSLLPF